MLRVFQPGVRGVAHQLLGNVELMQVCVVCWLLLFCKRGGGRGQIEVFRVWWLVSSGCGARHQP